MILTLAKLLHLANWDGVKLNQDSLFYVKPSLGGVSMHQDNVYQDWNVPGKLITATIVLTELTDITGGIEFIKCSHRWINKSKPVKNFFSGKSYKSTIMYPSSGHYEGPVPIITDARDR